MATLREIRERRAKKSTLAELRARKQAQKTNSKGLEALRKRKQQQRSSKHDFMRDGLRYHNVQQIDGYWMIDVSNNDKTYTLHNRYGSWMHDVWGSEKMAEPVQVARALGTNLGQLEISQALLDRLDVELRARGLPNRAQRVRQREEEQTKQRRQNRKAAEELD
jgi:hypothetical protein